MKLGFAIVVIVIFGGACAWLIHGMHRQPGDVEIGEFRYDLGEREVGESIVHDFVLKNETNEDQKIESIVSSCTCTVAERIPKEIPARGKVVMPVTAHVRRPGQFQSEITVSLAGRRPLRFELVGQGVERFPKIVDFGKVGRDGCDSKVILFTPQGESAELPKLEFDETFIVAEVARSDQNSAQQVIKLALRPKLPTGSFKRTLRVVTKEVADPVKQIELIGYVEKAVEAEPEMVVLGKIKDGETKSKEILLRAPYGGTVQISKIVVSDPRVIDASSVERSGQKVVDVRVNSNFSGRLFEGIIQITAHTTLDPKELSMEFRVYAIKP